MPIELSQLFKLGTGQRPSLQVGNLPENVAKYLNCHPAIVFLGENEFRHILDGHPEVSRAEYQMIFKLIKSGSYYRDASRPRSLTIYGYMEHNDKLYCLGLKSAAKGSEVWIQTMYRIDLKKARRKIKRCILIAGPGI